MNYSQYISTVFLSGYTYLHIYMFVLQYYLNWITISCIKIYYVSFEFEKSSEWRIIVFIDF